MGWWVLGGTCWWVGDTGWWVGGGLVGAFHDDNADGQLASSMVGLLVVGTGGYWWVGGYWAAD